MSANVEGGLNPVKQGDTLKPWSIWIADDDGTVPDLDDYDDVEFHAWSDASCPATDLIAWTNSNVTPQPTQTWTVDTDEDCIYCVNHGLRVGQQIKLSNSGGALPAAVNDTTRYFVQRINGHHVWIGKLKTGTAIEITTAGTGTHSLCVLGHVQYQPQAADVMTTGTYKCEVRLLNPGADPNTFPGTTDGIALVIAGDACD